MPVTLAVPAFHTPIDWKLRFCSAKVKYIEGERRRPSEKLARPPAPGAESQTLTRVSDLGYDSGLISTLLTTLKTAVLAPIAIASVRITVAANPGALASRRNAYLTSDHIDSRVGHCQAL